MANCPNCGRPAFRTLDWVCQWCGYPLLSNSYKKIDMTYREFQAQQNAALGIDTANIRDDETTATGINQPESKATSSPASRKQPVSKPEEKIAKTYNPEPESEREPEPEPEPVPEPRLEMEPEFNPEDEAELALNAEAKQESEREAEVVYQAQAESEPAPELKKETGAAPLTEPETAPEAAVVYAPEPRREPEETQTVVNLDAVKGGNILTVDQLLALFRANRNGIQSKLNGQPILLRGRVAKIFLRDQIDVRYIILDASRKGETLSVRCGFEKDKASRLTRLNEGETVTVRGVYDGIGKNIIFKNCELV